MKLWVDDVREAPDDSWHVVRTYQDAIDFVVEHKFNIKFISFDHDLGLLSITDGYELVKDLTGIDQEEPWMCEEFDFAVHSANPIGAENIRVWMGNYLRFKRTGAVR